VYSTAETDRNIADYRGDNDTDLIEEMSEHTGRDMMKSFNIHQRVVQKVTRKWKLSSFMKIGCSLLVFRVGSYCCNLLEN
jgi:hypothetical protein